MYDRKYQEFRIRQKEIKNKIDNLEKADEHKKITLPCLVEWDKLSPEIQDYDRQAVRVIPELLAKAGFEIYRLKKNKQF